MPCKLNVVSEEDMTVPVLSSPHPSLAPALLCRYAPSMRSESSIWGDDYFAADSKRASIFDE